MAFSGKSATLKYDQCTIIIKVGIKKCRGVLLKNATNIFLQLFERAQLLATTQRPE